MSARPRERHTTYLVAVSAERPAETTVYAVRMRSAAEALAAVAARAGNAGERPVIVGGLSTRTAKALGLKPGEMQPV